jgi:RNA recognition motif-containing protein
MNTKLYLDNLAATTTCDDLLHLFSAHGDVADINLPVDCVSGCPREFGFVTMATPEGARSAMQALNGKVVGSCTLTVGEAWPHEQDAASNGGRRSPRPSPSEL